MVKSVALTALGVLLLSVRHADPIDEVVRVVSALHLPLTSYWVDRILLLLAGLTVRKETALALAAFAYALLMSTEALALYVGHPGRGVFDRAHWHDCVSDRSGSRGDASPVDQPLRRGD